VKGSREVLVRAWSWFSRSHWLTTYTSMHLEKAINAFQLFYSFYETDVSLPFSLGLFLEPAESSIHFSAFL
jgi:hypothetical protein